MSSFLSAIKIWAAAAWADGVITEEEQAAMRALIDSTPLEESERGEALGWLDSPVDLEDTSVAELSSQARIGVYRATLRLVAVDRDVAGDEREFLDRLKDALQLDEQTAEQLEEELLG